MVRVISGTAGGLKLQTLDSASTRPTLDRVKEAVFSMLREEIYGSAVLDLFAGNGALGIEALSRGAAKCYFNDKSRQCCELVQKNLIYTKLIDSAELSCADYTEALSRYKRSGVKFNLILLDPPYGKGFDVQALELVEKFGLTVQPCTAVCEHSTEDRLPERIGHFTCRKEKKYGTVAVSVYENEVSSYETER